jgi:antirestriction protein ArdC
MVLGCMALRSWDRRGPVRGPNCEVTARASANRPICAAQRCDCARTQRSSTACCDAAYLDSWLQLLKNDRTAIFTAARHAGEAFEYILAREMPPLDSAPLRSSDE